MAGVVSGGKIGEERLVKDEALSGSTPPLKYSLGGGGMSAFDGRSSKRTDRPPGRTHSLREFPPAIRLASLEEERGRGYDCGREKGGKRRGEPIVTLDDNRPRAKRTFDRINRSLCIVLLNSVWRESVGGSATRVKGPEERASGGERRASPWRGLAGIERESRERKR